MLTIKINKQPQQVKVKQENKRILKIKKKSDEHDPVDYEEFENPNYKMYEFV